MGPADEAATAADQRIDFVSVATPNHTHFEIAKAFAEAGFNVMCDKPMTFDLAQAEQLAEVVKKTGVVFAVTHNYTGYPLVRTTITFGSSCRHCRAPLVPSISMNRSFSRPWLICEAVTVPSAPF